MWKLPARVVESHYMTPTPVGGWSAVSGWLFHLLWPRSDHLFPSPGPLVPHAPGGHARRGVATQPLEWPQSRLVILPPCHHLRDGRVMPLAGLLCGHPRCRAIHTGIGPSLGHRPGTTIYARAGVYNLARRIAHNVAMPTPPLHHSLHRGGVPAVTTLRWHPLG